MPVPRPAVGRRPAGSPRAALGGLTTRGRSFLAAGASAAVCSVLLGQVELLRIGLLLVALPLLCVLVLHRTRHDVVTTRELTPARVPVLVEARVRLRVHNTSRVPTGLLMLQDRVPHVLGPRPRFVFDRVEPGGRREVSYRVRSDLRGRYPLGPLQLRLADPFGMCELTRSCHTRDTLVVLPRVRPLPGARPVGAGADQGDGIRRALAPTGEDDVIPRAYRHGDDVRRVHWRSTARRGELMVRGEEPPGRGHCTVLLDTRRRGYAGAGPHSAFEWAVDGAASVAVHLLSQGHPVRLVTDTGQATPPRDDLRPSDAADLLLDTLATVTRSGEVGLAAAAAALRDRPGGRALLVAFLGELDAEQAALLARLRGPAQPALAFLVHDGPGPLPAPRSHGAAGGDGPPAGPATSPSDVLRAAGWTVVAAHPGADLAELWRAAGAPAAAGRSAVPPATGA